MQFKVNYFLLGTCCCTRTYTKHTDTLETHSNSIGNLEIFAIFSFVFGRARRTKTSKQNGDTRERTQSERARRILSYERQNWTDSKRRQQALVSLKLPGMLHSIDCHSSRTSRLALQSNRRCESEHVAANSCRFVFVWFASVSSSFRIPFVAQTCFRVECEQVSFAHWVLYRLITQLCCARVE